MLPFFIYKIKDKFLHIRQTWDPLAPDQAHAIEFAHTHINPEPARMLPSTKASPEYHLASLGDVINTDYRNNIVTEDYKAIEKMLSHHNTDTDLVLYRGICKDVLKSMIKNARKQANCDLYEKGYLSTSLVKGHQAKATYYLRIYVPAGTNVVYLGNVNYEEKKYYEVAIQHSSKLKIISIDNKYINCLLTETA